MEFGHTKITEVTARELSKKEISGFNEIKSELSLGKENCDNFWDRLFDSELDSDKIRDITEKAADKIEQQKIEGEIKEISKEYIEDLKSKSICPETISDSGIIPYTYKKDEKKLREILTETIIPGPIYERKSIQEEILGCVQMLKQPGLSVVQRQKLRSQIMKYTVSVPYYHWKNYQKALESKKDSCRKAKVYPAVQIGKYEKIEVMDCNYDDERGYSPIEWINERGVMNSKA